MAGGRRPPPEWLPDAELCPVPGTLRIATAGDSDQLSPPLGQEDPFRPLMPAPEFAICSHWKLRPPDSVRCGCSKKPVVHRPDLRILDRSAVPAQQSLRLAMYSGIELSRRC